MEYIMINEEKLKVTLEESDLSDWQICVDDLDYANPDAKSMFESILHYAKSEFGFDTSGHRVLLQLFPSKDGGCELFITRLGELSTMAEGGDDIMHDKKRAYSFEQLSHLLSVCKILCSVGFSGDSSAWRGNNGRWYLIFSPDDDTDDDQLPIITNRSFIDEYGERENPRALALYLGEYASTICASDAIAKLGTI